MNIINVGYQSTNYYAIDIKGGKLLVDCGWPGTLPQFTAELKRKGASIQDIKFATVHANPKGLSGVRTNPINKKTFRVSYEGYVR